MLAVQHSPSSCAESEFDGKMLRLRRWEGLGECVSYHVIGRAVNDVHFAFRDDPADEVKTDIDVFRSGVVLVILGECDG